LKNQALPLLFLQSCNFEARNLWVCVLSAEVARKK